MKFKHAILFSGAALLAGCATTSGDYSRADGYSSDEPMVRVIVVENAEELELSSFLAHEIEMPGVDDVPLIDSKSIKFRMNPDGDFEIVTQVFESPFDDFLQEEAKGDSEQNPNIYPSRHDLNKVDRAEVVEGFDKIIFTPFDNTRTLGIKKVPYGVGWWWGGSEDREYPGIVEIRVNDAGMLDVIVELPVEEYLRGVVPSEIGPTAPMEALKAQAVAARSETMTALRERVYEGPGYDICADVNCQVYAGIGRRNDNTDQAIRDTRGLVISYDGESIPAYYASNCGGHSEDIQNVWPTRDRGITAWDGVEEESESAPGDLSDPVVFAAWNESRPDVYCNRDFYPGLPKWVAKNFRWEREATVNELSGWLKDQGHDVGTLQDIELLDRGVSGRLNNVRFVGDSGEVVLGPELTIRRVWDPPLKSSAFVIEKGENADGKATYVVNGSGYGHGVGLCQTGAMARALEGQDFETILTHYYSGTKVRRMYE